MTGYVSYGSFCVIPFRDDDNAQMVVLLLKTGKRRGCDDWYLVNCWCERVETVNGARGESIQIVAEENTGQVGRVLMVGAVQQALRRGVIIKQQ